MRCKAPVLFTPLTWITIHEERTRGPPFSGPLPSAISKSLPIPTPKARCPIVRPPLTATAALTSLGVAVVTRAFVRLLRTPLHFASFKGLTGRRVWLRWRGLRTGRPTPAGRTVHPAAAWRPRGPRWRAGYGQAQLPGCRARAGARPSGTGCLAARASAAAAHISAQRSPAATPSCVERRMSDPRKG